MDNHGAGTFAFTFSKSQGGGYIAAADIYQEKLGAKYEFKLPKGSKGLPRRVKEDAVSREIFANYGPPKTWPSKAVTYAEEVDSEDEGAPATAFLVQSPQIRQR